ncbi:aminotransferase class I/II-fold pyridoxal phosphate-dependent enzyme [Bradyrhizobium sp. Gha]|uniref:pyridoxal phosphate-dependent aminotransferase n=1 Tax=Bradyrhizobium sp. Gha TaxID=1855318 RepID=UPI0015A648FB|nr:aminotransferase class I/II-fold pyridoxal phosphate-dependent enzyme [Bradyrhizobium sp. Gha]
MPSLLTSFCFTEHAPRGQDVASSSAFCKHQFIDLANDDIFHPGLSALERAVAGESGKSDVVDPIGHLPLRKAIAERIVAQTGFDWSPEEIAITAGSKEALLNAGLAVLEKGDEVIIIRPWQPLVPALVHAAGAVPVFVDARRPRYTPDVSSIRAAVTSRTKAMIINSPNNPTGAVYNRTTLQKVAELAIESQIWIISDERYSRLVFTGLHRHDSIVVVHPAVRSRTIMVNPSSQALAISGSRLGYFVAPRGIVSAARKLRGYAAKTPSREAQRVTIRHFRAGGHVARETYERIFSARDIGLNILSSLRDVTVSRADGAFFFYLDLSRLASALQDEGQFGVTDDFASWLLKQTNVACAGGEAFGDVSGLRVSFGVPPETLAIGLKRIVQALNSLRLR